LLRKDKKKTKENEFWTRGEEFFDTLPGSGKPIALREESRGEV
jgi:hypothetical protein